ncbi:hypothetical protein CTI12_AA372770 [Artemisia annua]|uniref:Retrotransposon gag domain-containing protein n=1 Tax=Artemisia annua TaxID=35608 RepID=A0A2U1MJP2_ARTAN|nr:hypothetical protein CTI12_AA372770 [Artemisia annua]
MAPSSSFDGAASDSSSLFQNPLFLHPSDGPGSLETYDIVQQGESISDYYTRMKCVWEELDSMNVLPRVTNITQEISVFLAAINTQKEEQRFALGVDSTALYGKSDSKDKCTICGFKWHPPEKCWEKVGYPVWHYKYKQGLTKAKQGQGKTGQFKKVAANVASVESGNFVFTSKQFEQLLKSLPQFEKSQDQKCDTDEELEVENYKQQINLPNGQTSIISQIGNAKLNNGLVLKDVLLVPDFKFSLLSVSKLAEDSNCFVTFYSQFCVIQDLVSRKVLGLDSYGSNLVLHPCLTQSNLIMANSSSQASEPNMILSEKSKEANTQLFLDSLDIGCFWNNS